MSYTVRLYTSDDSFTKLTPIPAWVGEIQVALAFARDYDADESTNGNFTPYWHNVTPTVITKFKEAALPCKVKVLVSIGNRGTQHPFKAGEQNLWVFNATKSLTDIIKVYNLDGIDVYYENIESGAQDFVDCIGKLVVNLKEKAAISVASIAPTVPLNPSFYSLLYEQYSNKIDTVVYQCFTETRSITSIESLVNNFNNIAQQFYPKSKLWAGYSTISTDWANVSPVLYYMTVFSLLRSGTVTGTAILNSPARGVTTSDSVTSFAPERVPS